MFCNKCGSPLPDGTKFCTNCGNIINTNVAPKQNTKGIDNIFSRISSDFNIGIKMELTLWILCCVSSVLFFVNLIIGLGNGWSYQITSIRVIWLFMLIFNVGMGVLMALRLRGINIMYANTAFYLIMLIPYYIKEQYIFRLFDDWLDSHTVIPVNIFFALAVINALAIIICVPLDIFTKIKLKLVNFILSIVMPCLTLCMMFFPYLLLIGADSSISDYFGLSYFGTFIIGSIVYFFVCCITSVYTILYCKNIISNNEKMFSRFNTTTVAATANMGSVTNNHTTEPVQRQSFPMVQCIKGSCKGQSFNIQGEVIIGSQPGSANIILDDAYVSRQHCIIRFNKSTGYYEVRDLSSNGVYLVNGVRFQKNTYTACQRGTVLCIGSLNQQLKLI